MANSSNFGDHHQYVDKPRYLILRPNKASIWELLRSSGIPYNSCNRPNFVDMSDEEVSTRLKNIYYFIICIFLRYFAKPIEYIGYVAEFITNLLSRNGNFFGLPRNLLSGNAVIPQRDSESFIAYVGNSSLDHRVEFHAKDSMEEIVDSASKETGLELGIETRCLMHLCVNASEWAYDKEIVIKEIVEKRQMHFVSFHSGWNDHLKTSSTQLFILCDKPKDANLILISFRGTEIGSCADWRVNFDISWYEISKSIFVHVGFLEALGLGNRDKMNFKKLLMLTKDTNCDRNDQLARDVEMVRESAYYHVKDKLTSLLKQHKNAKFVVTGHSQGGALAILLPTMLVVNHEFDIMNRFLGVYTFGQPRIGNYELHKFMNDYLYTTGAKYFRVVYGYDVVPRIPWDNWLSNFKHFGVCLHYDSTYTEHKVDDVPNPNLNPFNLVDNSLMHINAAWEIIRSFIIPCIFGQKYKEEVRQIIYRMTVGLHLPFISAHGLPDYINSVRLGNMDGNGLQTLKKIYILLIFAMFVSFLYRIKD